MIDPPYDYLSRLEITQFRNIDEVKIDPSPRFNLFCGENGSGKTSLLEAIYHLSVGRSFRTHLSQRVIQDKSDKFTVFGKLNNESSLGLERTRRGETRIRLNGEEKRSISELAESLPIQLIDPHSHLLLSGGPKVRRQFLDWGVFHVEHSAFLTIWRRYNRTLKQRNAGLKSDPSGRQAKLWDEELISHSLMIDQSRKKYINQYNKLFLGMQKELINIGEMAVDYHSGWYNDLSMEEALEQSIERDLRLGFTQCGPHKADLKLRINGTPVSDVLSRGQQKIVAAIMRISQAILLDKVSGKRSIFLVDDLPAELDKRMSAALTQKLIELDTQVFVTGIEAKPLNALFSGQDVKMFHVEHGKAVEEKH